jgi:dihydroflavonol-4-reductase
LTQARHTYLVTGATGFLGRHILEALRKAEPDCRIVVLVRDARSWEEQTWRQDFGGVEVLNGPLFPTDAWGGDPRLAGLTGIFHLAGEVKHSRSGTAAMFRTNVEGTAAMVRIAAERKCRLLFVSTSGTVGCSAKSGPGPYEDAPYCEEVVRGWPYYLSKIRAEQVAVRLAREWRVTLIIFRPPILLGPGDHRYRSTAHLLRLLRNKLPFIFPSSLHFTDVRDAAEAMVRAMLHANPRPIYHLTGTVCSLDDFFGMVAEAANMKPAWRVFPARLVWYLAKLAELTGLKFYAIPNPVIIEMGTHHWEISSRYAESDLGYHSRPAEETIADTVAWLRLNHPELPVSA